MRWPDMWTCGPVFQYRGFTAPCKKDKETEFVKFRARVRCREPFFHYQLSGLFLLPKRAVGKVEPIHRNDSNTRDNRRTPNPPPSLLGSR